MGPAPSRCEGGCPPIDDGNVVVVSRLSQCARQTRCRRGKAAQCPHVAFLFNLSGCGHRLKRSASMNVKLMTIGMAALGAVMASSAMAGMPKPAVASALSDQIEQARAICSPRGCVSPNYYAGRPYGSTRPHYFGGYTRPHYFDGYARPHHYGGYTRPHYFGEHTRGWRTSRINVDAVPGGTSEVSFA
ncbi:hypothetical protein V1281_003927 [Nitrobacteraceae bacterium AZCC 2161]